MLKFPNGSDNYHKILFQANIKEAWICQGANLRCEFSAYFLHN